MNRELLRQVLEYYQDLGIHTLYLSEPRTSASEPHASASGAVRPANIAVPLPAGRGSVQAADVTVPRGASASGAVRPANATEPRAPASGAGQAANIAEPLTETLAVIRADIGDCTRCRLHEGRSKIVFGSGHEQAKLVFVGEGPGADEDAQGLPFVGRAGQLLTQMIEGTARKEGLPLQRPDVYICNVVKCRPPENRTPLPDEMETCGQFLFRQLEAIRPKAICVLGATAAKALLQRKEGVTKMRGNWYRWRGIPVMVTYHPSYLLRPYNQSAKREAWEDLKKALHYVYD